MERKTVIAVEGPCRTPLARGLGARQAVRDALCNSKMDDDLIGEPAGPLVE